MKTENKQTARGKGMLRDVPKRSDRQSTVRDDRHCFVTYGVAQYLGLPPIH